MKTIGGYIPILKISNFRDIFKIPIISKSDNLRLLSLCLSMWIIFTSIPLQAQMSALDSVTSHGITWRFSEKAQVGQFVNGDYYVIGPVTIVSISPAPENGRNGSILNLPPDQHRSGFDYRVRADRYDESKRAKLPIKMVPGDMLVSSISVQAIGRFGSAFRGSDPATSPVQSVSVLTCLKQAVTADAFRPSYCDKTQKIYYANKLRRDLLPELSKVPSTPNLENLADHFQRPWLEVLYFGFDAAAEYQPQYGREVGRAVGMASLALMLDFTPDAKERLLINFIQYGIDLWGIVRAGYPGWHAHGGHGHGRKWPIIFAGILLEDPEMASPTKTFPNLKFSEDMQTMYGEGWTGAKVVYAGHMGKDGNEYKLGWGPYEHIHPSKWEKNLGEGYRRCCTSLAWIGQGLAARLMGAQKLWNHDAFFDYVDRWMFEEDTPFVNEILNTTGWDFTANWQRQGKTWDAFVDEMWVNYR
jgi:hypothetical protein